MTRRLQHIDEPAWRPLLLVMLFGIVIMLAGVVCQVIQVVVSVRRRDELRDETGDPWDGRSLEWSTPSPPPAFNFAVLPNVDGEEAYWQIKQKAIEHQALADAPDYKAIEVPRNSPTGVVAAFFTSFTGFAFIWEIWWLVGVSLVGAYATFVAFAWRDRTENEISAEAVKQVDQARREARAKWIKGRKPVGQEVPA